MSRRKCKMCKQFFERGVRRLHTGGVSPSMDYCPPCLLIWQRTPKKTQAEWKALRVRVLEQVMMEEEDEDEYDGDEIAIGTAEEAYNVARSLWDEEAEAAFYADEGNHCYVDENGIGPIIELP